MMAMFIWAATVSWLFSLARMRWFWMMTCDGVKDRALPALRVATNVLTHY